VAGVGAQLKVVITTIGTAGDIHPVIALSQALNSRGHAATICSYRIYVDKAAEAGVDFRETAPDVPKESLTQTMDAILGERNILRQTKLAVSMFLLEGRKRYEQCADGMKGADLVLCHHMDFPGQIAAIKSGVPWVVFGFCPFFIPTSERAPAYSRILNFGPTLNRLLWRLAARIQERWFFRDVAEFCVALGVPRLGVWTWLTSPHLNICASSSHIAAQPRDLASHTIMPGAWPLREESVETPEIDRFIANGSAPVVVTFGSMASGNSGVAVVLLLKAIRAVGLRAILQKGWANLLPRDFADDVLTVGYIPHEQLFRGAFCVIHHGGAGTTAAACRAGVPSIVVAHGGDQFYWGQCLERKGIAPPPLTRRKMNARNLQQRLQAIKNDPGMAKTARAVSFAMAAEDGLGATVDALERLIGSGPGQR